MIDFKTKPIFAMIHLAGDDASKRADEEIQILQEEKIDGIIIENYHSSLDDVRKVLGWMAEIDTTNFKIGLNILPNECDLSFALAHAYDLDFIQIDAVAGRYIGHSFDVHNYMRLKSKYPNITVLGGIHPKYYKTVHDSILEDDIEEGMKRAEAIVVTGSGTGKETPISKIKEFRELLGNHPLIIGAGLNASNVGEQLKIADGAIVGSCLKQHGITTNPIDRDLVREFMDAVKKARQ